MHIEALCQLNSWWVLEKDILSSPANSQQEKDVLLDSNLKDFNMLILSYVLLSIYSEGFPLLLQISLILWTKKEEYAQSCACALSPCRVTV